VLIANGTGKALGYALFNLQERGKLFIGPGDEVYEGMVIGMHSRDNDLVVNALKAKQLTNIRAAGTDENIQLTPPIRMTLEQAIEFIDDDELVEVTPEEHPHPQEVPARARTQEGLARQRLTLRLPAPRAPGSPPSVTPDSPRGATPVHPPRRHPGRSAAESRTNAVAVEQPQAGPKGERSE
jgi:hypothetical protein